ncbi:hypothetical protein FOXB_08190 [Fusarium oxysporum f. sp. conglutinans Fo5176]|uniref:N-acetyltransferase domain-containing protein n=1 Tax=Fusarium oxysporum (strain Fo5176) TaxID=660025 RepID=F9FP60_FUSOF|nr:hypothetical protein FOXB_08190 [Fusarium oxysporum f. sp. conglutinans Fo5176]
MSVKSKFQSRSWKKDRFFISTDPNLFPLSQLAEAFNSDELYWTEALSPEAFREILDNSLSFGLYEEPQSSTTSEVKTYQGKGLGSWLVRCIREVLDEMPHLRRTMLLTGDWERSVPFYEKLLRIKENMTVELTKNSGLC